MKRMQRSFIWGMLLVVFGLAYLLFRFPAIQTERVAFFGNVADKIAGWIPSILLLLIIIILTNLIINVSVLFITKYFEKRGKREEDLFLIIIVYKYIIWFLAVMISLSVLFKNFASLLTSLGLIGFGITFALQKPILNFVGWLSIIANGPYKIGDRIMINNFRGDVFNIKVMYTYIREVNSNDDLTGRVVSIPNEFVLSYQTTNFTKGTPYIWREISFAVTYESNWKEAIKIIEKIADEVVGETMKKLAKEWKDVHRKFDSGTSVQERPSILLSLADSWINIRLRYLVHVREGHGINTKINSLVLERFSKARNIKLAYPHMHVMLDKS